MKNLVFFKNEINNFIAKSYVKKNNLNSIMAYGKIINKMDMEFIFG